MGHPFRVHDTLRRSILSFEPHRPGHVGIYVCGMTVYDHAHVGHARAMVVFDALVRTLRHRGWEVTYVRNYTDVDDKIIRRARERGEAPLALAQRYVDAFREDMHALGLLPPDAEPRVTEHIPEIVAMIEALLARGHAYVVPSGDVFFAVSTSPGYGSLSRQRADHLDASADADTGKRDRRDFALWKAARPGEPRWDAPWTHSDCAISFSWCGNTRSRPPPWMSSALPSVACAIAEHSMCHPGRPGPHGASQRGSPGRAAFQSAKSRRSRLPVSASALASR